MSTVVFSGAESISRARAQCSFCRALLGERERDEPSVLEDDHFVAWVSEGALVEGHLLAVPRRHSLSLRQAQTAEPLFAFVARVSEFLASHYGPVAMFEHGPCRQGSAVGCSTDHAHLHFVPWTSSLVERAESDYPTLPWSRVSGLRAVLDVDPAVPYLLVQDADGTATMAAHPGIPSQAIRRSLARATEREGEWNWKTHPQEPTVARTLRRLLSAPS